jgi:methenyltetrahydrofolate cyclohydrolase
MTSNAPIAEFLAATASKQPTPGGGAVAALVGATGAAIGEMVLAYSVGRKTSAAFDAELTTVLHELSRARQMMLELLVEDQHAFAELQASKKLPETDAARAERVKGAVAVCIAVPQSIATTALRVLELADAVVEKSNKWLLSDLAVCVELSMATLRSGLHNVRANFGEVDPARRAQLEGDCDRLLLRGIEVAKRVMPKIQAAMG